LDGGLTYVKFFPWFAAALQDCYTKALAPPTTSTEELSTDSSFDIVNAAAVAEADVLNPCGITKSEPMTVYRRHGGLLTGMLGCGTVVTVDLVPGRESCTHIYGVLSIVAARRQLEYVIYDNACFLGRFIRNQRRRFPGSIPEQIAGLRFVLDRWHAQNHRACLDPTHSLYMPEVDISQYPALRDRNTAWNESWNSWIDNVVPQVRHMTADALAVYALLLAELWNQRVVQPRMHVGPPHAVGPRHVRARGRGRG